MIIFIRKQALADQNKRCTEGLKAAWEEVDRLTDELDKAERNLRSLVEKAENDATRIAALAKINDKLRQEKLRLQSRVAAAEHSYEKGWQDGYDKARAEMMSKNE